MARLKRVQRLSGAVVMSARKPSLMGGPLPTRMSEGSGADGGEDASQDLSEDEEFAAEEHAHRWVPVWVENELHHAVCSMDPTLGGL